VRACAQRIERALVRSATLIDRFSRLVQAYEVAREPIDLREALHEVFELLRHQFVDHDLALVIRQPDAPVPLFGSINRIHQVMLALGLIGIKLAARAALVQVALVVDTVPQIEILIDPPEAHAEQALVFLQTNAPVLYTHAALPTLMICRTLLVQPATMLRAAQVADPVGALKLSYTFSHAVFSTRAEKRRS
ncbi:MAG TPA: hypothetical protein PKC19_09995, partial [Roseiflexaceae bacterium]|nr:hypothetical protein [Roseiflexaceae bacterium]